MGEAIVDATRLAPSRLAPLEKIRAIGIMSTGTIVLADPAQGFVPTIW